MLPKSFSATAITAAGECLSRYYWENVKRTPGRDNIAAQLGTSVHGALEDFVKGVHIDKTFPDDKLYLEKLYVDWYNDIIGSSRDGDWWKDGLAMIRNWHDRTDFSDLEVISCEKKTSFPIPTSAGPIPFNYIWDRFDRIKSSGEYQVIDYKTIRVPVNAAKMRTMWQPRCYSMAARIQVPEADRIWVVYDLLRHDRVGLVFTREDDIATWKALKRQAEEILSVPEDNIPETINTNCKWCIRKAGCKALTANIVAGSIHSLTTTEEAAEKLNIVSSQMQALKSLEEELNEMLVKEAELEDKVEWTAGKYKVGISASKRRATLPEVITRSVDSSILADYVKLNVGDWEKLVDDPRLSDKQREIVKKAITTTTGEPKAKITKTGPLV